MRRLANRIAQAVTSVIGAREATLVVGLAMVGYGAGAIFLPAGFILPGALLVYISIAGLR